MTSFTELPISDALQRNLLTHNYKTPTSVQEATIEPAMEGKDIVATAQTGTGKTLAFALPVIHRLASTPAKTGIRAIILSPTRELALQINETFVKLAPGTGIKTGVAVGGMSEGPQLQSIKRGANVLIATPGRLFDFLDRKLVRLENVSMLVLDEADRMLDMGFLPSIKKLIAILPPDRQTLLFSATIESSVKHLVDTYVRNAVRVAIGSATRPVENIDLHLYEVEQDQKLDLLGGMLKKEEGSFLVFARTKRGADRLSQKLSGGGVKSTAIHGDRSQNQRNQALKGFQDGYYRVLVATDVAARGIHVEGISHVVNYDLPQIPEDFIHRVGRTGRAGAKGTASTFATRSERKEIGHIERTIEKKLLKCQIPATLVRESRESRSMEYVAVAAAAPTPKFWHSAPKPTTRFKAPSGKPKSRRSFAR
ncbi:MAG: DEAD/DEAH box helicase [Acidobacteriota bacterium]